MFSVNNFSLSIFQQRIILIVFLVVIGAAASWPNTGSINYPVQKISKTPVPVVVANLDFTKAESAWSDLQFDQQGNLKIDGLTETALLDAIALMHDQISELEMARMALLIEKQFGETASQQIMALVPILKNYKEIEQRWWEESGSNNLSADKLPAYEELFLLQDELLGETRAKLMFAEQRRLIKMMLASYQIQNDASLSQTEKEQALMALQANSQDSLQGGFQESAPNE